MAALAELELLEREPEVAALRPVLEAAHEGAGRLVVVEGPPGIGKTRLLATARGLATEAGLEALWGRGGEFEREFPYGVARQLFEPLLGRLDPAAREELLGGAAGLAAPLFDPGREAPDAGPDGSFATGHGLYWLLVNLSARRPVLVAVDDLHWVDPPTLRFLAYLQRRLDGLPVVLATGLRPGEADAGDPPPAAVIDDPGRLVLRPRPLTGDAVARYVAMTLEAEPEPAFADACERASGGNPLLLRELLIALRAEGIEPSAGRAGAVHAVGSQALAGRVRRRLERLGPHAADLAAAAAVLGDGASLRMAAELAGLGGDASSEATERLMREDVLRLDGNAIAFSHPIVRAAVYGNLRPERLHAEAARLLAAAGASPEAVAAHLVHAPPAGDAWAVAALRHAARRSLAEGAADAAARDLRRALEEPPSPAERTAIMFELGLAQLRSDPPAAIHPLEEALAAMHDPDERAEATLELSRALSTAGRIEDAVDVLGHGLDDLRAAPERLTQLEAELIGLCRYLPDRYALAAERLARVRLPLRPEGEALTTGEAMLLANLASEIARSGERREEAIALARQALAGGRLMAELNSAAYSIAIQALVSADELPTALALYDEGLADARARGAISRYMLGSAFRAGVAFRLGLLDDAEADALTVIESAEGRHVSRFWASAVAVDALIERGKVAEAATVLDAVPISDHPAGAYYMLAPRESRARLRLAQGRAAEAAQELLAFGRDVEAVGIRNPAMTPWRSLAAVALVRAGEPEQAAALAAEEVELARRWGARRALGMALRAHGLAAGGAGGLALLSEAADVLADSHSRLEHARALTDLGAALRRAGRRSDARRPLRQALDLAHACGATAMADTAHTELVASGAKPRRQALSGAESLTPSERRVASMAAEGLTNRDIAQSLFVTPKTVEVHLSSAYRKLGIGSRTQLAAALGD